MSIRKIGSIGAAVGLTVLLVMVLIRAPQPSPAAVARTGEMTTGAPTYVVREWNGQLAVFEEGDTHPDMIYDDVAVSALPPEEQERLRQGIPVSDRAALNRLLEDYTS